MQISLSLNKNNHGVQRAPWLTLGLVAMTLMLYVLGGGVFDALYIHKLHVSNGEWWRIFYGHFVHFTFDHLFWDVVALAILGAVIEYNNPKDLLPSFVVSCLFVSGWFLLFPSEWSAYCGLSGALNGLLVVAALRLYEKTENRTFLLAIGLTIAKTVFELTTHQTIFSDVGSQAVPQAHVAGLLAGLVYIFTPILVRKGLLSKD